MKINEVEAAVGITKKNIRFYEEEGLLHPRRNSENGYRDYSEQDIARLQRIKLLRKLDVPLAEIKAMLDGKLPLSEGMRRHSIALEHRLKSIEEAQAFCIALSEEQGMLDALDANAVLERVQTKEAEGMCFVNVEKKDEKKARKHSAIFGAALFVGCILLYLALLVWLIVSEEGTLAVIPMPVLVLFALGFGVPIIGVGVALVQRIKEIQKGEDHDYSNY